MDKQSFYIELVSNSKSFPENTVANFKNRICLDNSLIGNWEMAVVEISYTYSWMNIKDVHWVALTEERTDVNSLQYSKYLKPIKFLDGGHYKSINELIDGLQLVLEECKTSDVAKMPKIEFNPITKYLHIKPGLKSDGTRILPDFDSTLLGILGYDNYTTVRPEYGENGLKSDRPPDINAGFRTMFVYTKHIVPQYLGDTRANILKTVEVPNNLKFGDQVVIKYDNPHYVPILFNDFEIVEIDIRDATGERLQFLYGFTLIKLHLRKQI